MGNNSREWFYIRMWENNRQRRAKDEEERSRESRQPQKDERKVNKPQGSDV